MPWEKNYDHTQVVERAMHAFWARGYEATSMNDLVAATGINRGSIYAAFTSKHGLFVEALLHYDKIHRKAFFEEIVRKNAPKDAILAVFDAAVRQGRKGDTPRGCLIVNTVLELSPHDSEIRDLTQSILHDVEDFFEARIRTGQDDGSVRAEIDPRKTAQALLGLFLGVHVLTRSGSGDAALKAITSQARLMLE